MRFGFDNFLEFKTDPFKRELKVKFMELEGTCKIADILPLEGKTDVEKMKSQTIKGMSTALGITPAEIKTRLEEIVCEIQDYIDQIKKMIGE